MMKNMQKNYHGMKKTNKENSNEKKCSLEDYCEFYKKIKNEASDKLLLYGIGVILWSCVIVLFLYKCIL